MINRESLKLPVVYLITVSSPPSYRFKKENKVHRCNGRVDVPPARNDDEINRRAHEAQHKVLAVDSSTTHSDRLTYLCLKDKCDMNMNSDMHYGENQIQLKIYGSSHETINGRRRNRTYLNSVSTAFADVSTVRFVAEISPVIIRG